VGLLGRADNLELERRLIVRIGARGLVSPLT
jgi:hypothetical protein